MGAADDVLKDMHQAVLKTLDTFKGELSKLRTGRASLGMLDGIKVDYYGTPTQLNGVASLSVADARLIVVKPWDKGLIAPIEKAIREANIGLNPQNDGEIVRLPVPPLTEERRKDIVKQVKVKGEEFKVAIRNERRDAKEMIEEFQKSGDISEDDAKKALEKMQKETDEGVKKVEEIVAAKEKEVMQV
jgi:ribosome recycling factor